MKLGEDDSLFNLELTYFLCLFFYSCKFLHFYLIESGQPSFSLSAIQKIQNPHIYAFSFTLNHFVDNPYIFCTYFAMLSSPGQTLGAIQQFLIEFLLSGTSAAISKSFASPIEVVKIRLQLQQALIEKKTLQDPYTGMIDCFKRIYSEEGFRAYYKGNFTNVIRYFPTQALNFAFKNFYSKTFTYDKSKASFWKGLFSNMIYGSAAGASTQFFVYPLDYIRTRLTNDIQMVKQGAQRQFTGIFDCMKKTIEWDGIRGVYRGFVVSCVFMMIYRGIYFGLNDSLKPIIPHQIIQNIFFNFLVSYGITITSGIVAYPLDTVRRRMMMSSGEKHKFNSSIQCISYLYKEHGMRSFYGGVGANIIRGITGAGVLTIYDRLQLVLFGKKYSSGQG